jgi:hypothetical protein
MYVSLQCNICAAVSRKYSTGLWKLFGIKTYKWMGGWEDGRKNGWIERKLYIEKVIDK